MVGRTLGLWAARQLRWDVTWFDCAEPTAATKASAGVIHPRWLAGFGPLLPSELISRAVEVLDELYPVIRWQLDARTTAYRVAAAHVLTHPDVSVIPRRVTAVDVERGAVCTDDGEEHRGVVLVSTGAALDQLAWGAGPVYPRVGGAVRYATELPYSVLVPYAPYKQLMVFNEVPGTVYAADGVAVTPRTWTARGTYLSMLDRRARAVVGTAAPLVDYAHGWRPYRKDGPVFRRLGARGWAAGAGYKSSTALSGVWAQWLVHDLQRL